MNKLLVPAIVFLVGFLGFIFIDPPFTAKSLIALLLLAGATVFAVISVLKASGESQTLSAKMDELSVRVHDGFERASTTAKEQKASMVESINVATDGLLTKQEEYFSAYCDFAKEQTNAITRKFEGELLALKADYSTALEDYGQKVGSRLDVLAVESRQEFKDVKEHQSETNSSLADSLSRNLKDLTARGDMGIEKLAVELAGLKDNIAVMNGQVLNQVAAASEKNREAMVALGSIMTAQAQTMTSVLAEQPGGFNADKGQWEVEDEKVRKIFSPGQLLQVVNHESNTTSTFAYNDAEKTVTCDVAVDGVLRYRTISSRLGAPLKGWEFSPEGDVKVEYAYNNSGQLESRSAS